MADQSKIDQARAALKAKLGSATRVGGVRKVVKTAAAGSSEDKKFVAAVKKIQCQNIPGCGEATFFHSDNTVTRIMNPVVLANPGANTFVVSGVSVNKPVTEVLGEVYQYMGLENLAAIAGAAGAAAGDDEDVPELVENFDEKQ